MKENEKKLREAIKKISNMKTLLMLLLSVFCTAFKIGESYQSVSKDIKISIIMNKCNLDFIDVKEKYNEKIEMSKDSISLLHFRYERKKTR